MEIINSKNGGELTLKLIGRLDTITAPELETVLSSELEGVTKLVFDFTELAYISSAGLRQLLSAQKKMNKQGEMIVTGANEDIMEIFDITGFVDILTIE